MTDKIYTLNDTFDTQHIRAVVLFGDASTHTLYLDEDHTREAITIEDEIGLTIADLFERHLITIYPSSGDVCVPVFIVNDTLYTIEAGSDDAAKVVHWLPYIGE